MKNWRGWLIDESLKDKSVLKNPKLKIVRSLKEENAEGDTLEIWTLHIIEVEDKNIQEVTKFLEKNIKVEYYTHLTNEKELIIIFPEKSFKMELVSVGKEKGVGITKFKITDKDKSIWKKAVEYGTHQGKVDSRYLIEVD